MKLTSSGTGSRTARGTVTNSLTLSEKAPNDLSILGGLSHPLGRLLVGPTTADIWLTGGDVRGGLPKYISLDQRIAMIQGRRLDFLLDKVAQNANRYDFVQPSGRGNPSGIQCQIFDRLFQ